MQTNYLYLMNVMVCVGYKKRKHFIEAFIDVFSGYCLSVLVQIIIFPFFNIHIKIEEMLIIGGIFTIVSITRSWLWRRYFHWRFYDKST